MQIFSVDSAEWSENRDWGLNEEGSCQKDLGSCKGILQLSCKMLVKYQIPNLSSHLLIGHVHPEEDKITNPMDMAKWEEIMSIGC